MTQDDVNRLKVVHPDLRDRYLKAITLFKTTHGMDVRPTETLRSESAQMELFKIGRILNPLTKKWTVVGKTVTNALPRQSWHLFGLAIDSCFDGHDPYLESLPEKESEGLWLALGEAFETFELTWGGRFKGVDRPHCEFTYGLSLKDAQTLYAKAGVMAVWNKVDAIITCGGHLV
jgi:hypothetical protein